MEDDEHNSGEESEDKEVFVLRGDVPPTEHKHEFIVKSSDSWYVAEVMVPPNASTICISDSDMSSLMSVNENTLSSKREGGSGVIGGGVPYI